MINTINTEPRLNAFDVVSKNTSDIRYWQLSNTDLNLPQPNNIPQKRKHKNYTAIGLSIGAATIIVAGTIFFILKGGPKGLGQFLKNISTSLETHIQKAKLEFEEKPLIVSGFEFLKRKTDSLIRKTEIVNNWTTIKDYTIKRLMYGMSEKSPGAKLHKAITKLFQNIARKTVINSYKETGSFFTQAQNASLTANGKILSGDLYKTIEINGEKLTRLQWIEKLVQMNKELVKTYKQYFSPKNVDSRFSQLYDAALEVEKEFGKDGLLWFLSKNTFKSFVAESKLLSKKIKIQDEVVGFRKEISYSIFDLIEDAEKILIEITKSIDYKDTDKLKNLRDISKYLSKFKKTKDPKIRAKIQEQIIENIEKLQISVLRSDNIDNTKAKEILKNISQLLALKNFKQGKIQDILDIYRVLLPKSQYEKLKQQYKISTSHLDKSIQIETEDFMNKLRDLSLGSAPTDVITMLSGFVTLGYFLWKSDDYRERTSVSLKYGIPALVGIGTSLYGNAKLFAGSKSMLFGFISMILTNKLGDITNSILIHRWEKQDKLKKQEQQLVLKS